MGILAPRVDNTELLWFTYKGREEREKGKADEDRLLLGPISLGGRAFRGPNTTYLVK